MNLDSSEILKFKKLKKAWWDPQGELKTLHDINPLRLQYILSKVQLKNKKVLDIGCGGGILSEAMARSEGIVTGIDMCEEALNAANEHQAGCQNPVEYHLATAEDFSNNFPNQYDVVTCLELLEHVPDPNSVLLAASALLKSGGYLFLSTLNRTIKSYLYAIIGAEYLLKLVPRGTHDYEKFIKPSELATSARKCNLTVKEMVGITYNPFTKKYSLTQDTMVNYIMYLVKN